MDTAASQSLVGHPKALHHAVLGSLELARYYAGMETATRAAAAGGITTVIDMPLNNEPTTTTSRLVEQKIWASWVHP